MLLKYSRGVSKHPSPTTQLNLLTGIMLKLRSCSSIRFSSFPPSFNFHVLPNLDQCLIVALTMSYCFIHLNRLIMHTFFDESVPC